MFCNFSLKLNMANRRLFYSAWAPETGEHIKEAKNKIALKCNVQKVIPTLAFRRREKFDNSFFFFVKIVGIV